MRRLGCDFAASAREDAHGREHKQNDCSDQDVLGHFFFVGVMSEDPSEIGDDSAKIGDNPGQFSMEAAVFSGQEGFNANEVLEKEQEGKDGAWN